mgnify:CR=1 FL=1
MIEQFVNRYPLSKTLRFGLIPQGNTEENFKIMQILEKDEALARNYGKAKEIIDRYHKFFINSCLVDFHLTDLEKYALLYYEPNKTEEEVAAMDETAKTMRQAISGLFCKENKAIYDRLSKKDLIENFAMSIIETDEERTVLESFRKCTVYFTGFNQNRLNMYTGEGKSTEIAHRLINQNLPKFLDNARIAKTILAALPKNDLDQIDVDFYDIFGINTQNIFEIPFYNQTLTQAGIDRYNQIIGKYNEYINHFMQETKQKLPKFKPLYKQILSDRETISFIPKAFQSDSEVLSALRNFYIEKNAETDKSIQDVITELKKLFQEMDSFDENGIYITNGVAITDLSQAVCDNWFVIKKAMQAEYDAEHSSKNRNEDYEKKRGNDLKKVKSYSLSALQRYMDSEMEEKKSLAEYIKTHTTQLCDLTASAYERVRSLLETEYSPTKKLTADADSIGRIKDFLDSIMEVFHFAKIFLGSGEEAEKDDVFYGIFSPLYDQLSSIVKIYDSTRNYVTKKPYSTDKIYLSFGYSNLMNGWTDSKTATSDNGTQYGGYLFRKKNGIGEYDYYLGISKNVKLFRFFEPVSENDKSEYERLDYYQIKEQTFYGALFKGNRPYDEYKKEQLDCIKSFVDATKDKGFIITVNALLNQTNTTPKSILSALKKNHTGYYEQLLDTKQFRKINEDTIQAIKNTLETLVRIKNRDNILKKTYTDFIEIMDDIGDLLRYKSYRYFHISREELELSMNDDRKPLFLFKITNKDLEYADKYLKGERKSRGTDNLHTMYFRALMSGEQSVFDIGTGSVYYRKASISYSDELLQKGHHAQDLKDKFLYPIIKDKRYVFDSFQFHLSMTQNYTCDSKTSKGLDLDIRKALLKSEHQYIIGIDRGERNLLYVCVINEKGEIVEQMSLNEIIGDNGYTVDYHELLDRKEKERDAARKSWGTIENIKELKEGYMSQVIHKICELVLKYDAVIAMEDLNGGFMNSRIKIEKQVYRKFEKMLTDKLNYLVDKKADPMSDGGLLRAYQLTNMPDGKGRGLQDGILFYIPAWCTSKIDPTTGFVDLLRPKNYRTMEAAKDFFGRFQKIGFQEAEDLFAFHFRYSDFPNGSTAGDTAWTVCTNGSRIRTYRNPKKNNEWDYEEVALTDAFKALFQEYGIPCNSDMKAAILSQNSFQFYKKLCDLLALTLQMRNSISGRTDMDYIISPVKNASGQFYDSRTAAPDLPRDADANGAYNIARKVLLFIRKLKEQDVEHLMKVSTNSTKAEWLTFARNCHE